jgi:hypothetical protein
MSGTTKPPMTQEGPFSACWGLYRKLELAIRAVDFSMKPGAASLIPTGTNWDGLTFSTRIQLDRKFVT